VNKAAQSEIAPVVHEIRHVFNDFAICNELKVNIGNKGFATPTPIQDQAIPYILEGRDVIGIANTGTGKTAAFLIPTIDKVFKNKREKVLIVAPTRELALQINDEFHAFAKGMRLFSVLTIGGASLNRQRQELRRGHDFVIGTPGRLKDLIQQKALDLSQFHTVILDEVDRMVDIGFIRDIQFLISFMPKVRHSLFFSATVTDKVDEILKQFVSNPVTVSVKTSSTAETIEQDIIKVPMGSNKVDTLHDLLIKTDFEKVMVFGRTKWGIEKLTKELVARGFKAASIHGNKTQGQRQRALGAFKSNEISILLATDVASRGIDVEDVSHVINYDAPETYDDYVHRIGRTGRANKKGKALTFVE
jgi:superfamily II DNA/RNA helicase